MPRPFLAPLASLALLACAAASVAAASVAAGEPTPCPIPAGFVRLSSYAPEILQELRYAGSHNFVGRKVEGYHAAECILSIPAARALKLASDFARSARMDPTEQGARYAIKVYDCYRPARAVADFVSWSRTEDARMRAEFFPTLQKSDLFAQGYIAERSGHSRGSTVDLTLVPLPAAEQPVFTPGQALTSCAGPLAERWADNSLDMGGGFDCFHPVSWTNSSDVAMQQQFNRQLLLHAMHKAGFVNYPLEWWHYTLRDEPFPEQIFDFPVC